jgi:hypothetical protein
VDWKGKRRKFPLGSHLNRARNKLSEYRRKNDAEFDFNKNKTERNLEAMTFSNNKEVSTLRKFLRLARKKGFIDKVTEFEMAQERSRRRVLIRSIERSSRKAQRG